MPPQDTNPRTKNNHLDYEWSHHEDAPSHRVFNDYGFPDPTQGPSYTPYPRRPVSPSTISTYDDTISNDSIQDSPRIVPHIPGQYVDPNERWGLPSPSNADKLAHEQAMRIVRQHLASGRRPERRGIDVDALVEHPHDGYIRRSKPRSDTMETATSKGALARFRTSMASILGRKPSPKSTDRKVDGERKVDNKCAIG